MMIYASGSRSELSMGVNAILNREAMKDALHMLKSNPEPLLGCFNGIPEYSFRISARMDEVVPFCRLMFERYNQEAVLIVGETEGTAHLRFADGTVSDMGELKPYDKMPAGDWSFDGRSFWQLG